MDPGSQTPKRPIPQHSFDSQREGGASAELHARDQWLARALREGIRAPLLRALPWTEHLQNRARAIGRSETGFGRGPASVGREVARALRFLQDLLVVIQPPEGSDDRRPWLRSIVVRDLLHAALRGLEKEIEEAAVVLEHEVRPADLTLVADPDQTLHAVDALLRIGVRCTRRGEGLSVVVSGPDAAPPSPGGAVGWVTMSLELSEPDLPPGIDLGHLCDGRPWRWPGDSTGDLPLAMAAAGRWAAIGQGSLDVAKVREGTVRTRLRLPTGREPERRPGWIP